MMFTTQTHQLVLVSCDGDEDGFRENEGLEVGSQFHDVHESGAVRTSVGSAGCAVIALLGDVDARLVFVHAVQDDLLLGKGGGGKRK